MTPFAFSTTPSEAMKQTRLLVDYPRSVTEAGSLALDRAAFR